MALRPGASIGTALISSILTGGLRPDGLPTESAFTAAFAATAVAAALAIVVALLVPRRHTRHGATTTTTPALPETAQAKLTPARA
ncbi:hypothetical protein ABT297_28550 [Dactylosporangium sp. NPDC000555]|uniref:hypothetical protein n=1 Tax=Dactylosporangium sp. NPDC000555 TaxID=3154260 RepID=UPI00332BB8F5